MSSQTLEQSPTNASENGDDANQENVDVAVMEVPDTISIDWEQESYTAEQTVSMIVEHAFRMGASDIFFSSQEDHLQVSVRHLGVIKIITVLPPEVGLRCISYMRTQAKMRFGERRHPQDGRWVFTLSNGEIVDLRINAMPTLHGESVAIRLLRRDSELRKLESLGFVGPQLGALISMLHSNSGLILVTGPTGSGKTTSLYACLHYLNDGRRKIHTIEDPIEYAVAGLHQSQVDSGHGSLSADFLEMLRGVIRQGPDVIMIGEVRDVATAETAVRAANSGQLVFASLHAAVAATGVQSMLSLGVKPYFLCTSLLAVLGQRLMRTLRMDTRVPIDLSSAPHTFDEVRDWLEYGQGNVAYAASADGDRNEGYIGRTGVYEVMTLTPSVRRMIQEARPASELHNRAVEDGMLDFRRAALLKVAQGITTFDEMQRILPTGDTWLDL